MSMNSIAPVRSSRSIISESERDQPVAYLSMHSIWVWLSPNALNSFSLCVCTNTFKRSLALYHGIRCQLEKKIRKFFPHSYFFLYSLDRWSTPLFMHSQSVRCHSRQVNSKNYTTTTEIDLRALNRDTKQ